METWQPFGYFTRMFTSSDDSGSEGDGQDTHNHRPEQPADEQDQAHNYPQPQSASTTASSTNAPNIYDLIGKSRRKRIAGQRSMQIINNQLHLHSSQKLRVPLGQ